MSQHPHGPGPGRPAGEPGIAPPSAGQGTVAQPAHGHDLGPDPEAAPYDTGHHRRPEPFEAYEAPRERQAPGPDGGYETPRGRYAPGPDDEYDAYARPARREPGYAEAPRRRRSPNAGVVARQGRPGVFVYPFWQRSEFLVFLITSLAVGIAAAATDTFGAESAWQLIALMGAAYILSRGLAKREPRDDDGDSTWTPGDDGSGREPGGRFDRRS